MVYQPSKAHKSDTLIMRSEPRVCSLASSYMGIDGRPVQRRDVALISLVDVEGLIASSGVVGETFETSDVS